MMKQIKLAPGSGSAANKLVNTAAKVGIRDITRNQGTTRVLYDSVDITAGTREYVFFSNPSSAAFAKPLLNNLDKNQGLLGPGETLAIEHISFSIVGYKLSVSGAVSDVSEFDLPINSSNTTVTSNFYAGTFETLIGNNVVMKPISCQSLHPNFNPSPVTQSEVGTFQFKTDLVVLPNLTFAVILRLPASITPSETITQAIRCTITGRGTILNLNTTL
jgi:hypothetical protein